MSVEGPVTDVALYGRAKAFADSISAGNVLVKHAGEENDDIGDVPF